MPTAGPTWNSHYKMEEDGKCLEKLKHKNNRERKKIWLEEIKTSERKMFLPGQASLLHWCHWCWCQHKGRLCNENLQYHGQRPYQHQHHSSTVPLIKQKLRITKCINSMETYMNKHKLRITTRITQIQIKYSHSCLLAKRKKVANKKGWL